MTKWAMTLMLALAPVAAVADEGAAPSTPQQSQPAPETRATDATSAAGATRATNAERKTPPPPLADPYHKPQAEPKATLQHAGENPVEGPQPQRH